MSQAGSYIVVEDLTHENRIFDELGSDLTPKPLVFTARRSSRKSSVRSKHEEIGMEVGGRTYGKRTSKDGQSSKIVPQEVEKDYLKELDKVKETLKMCKLDMDEGGAQTAPAASATAALRLRESAYHWHLVLPSGNAVRSADADTQVETDGVVELSRRYRLNQAAQTFNPVSKKKMSQTAPIELSTSCVFASEWDLYDTYRRLSYEDEEAELDSEDFDLDSYIADAGSNEPGTQRPSVTSVSTEGEQSAIVRRANVQVQKLVKLSEFKYATTIAERLLSSNTFHEKQVAFMGVPQGQQDVSTGFRYIMNELWSFSYEDSKNRIVNAVAWNTVNINVVAVGYGYEQGSGDSSGLVCCWSAKNPSQPERVFSLRSSVNALSFSRTRPNLLAIGCYNGAVIVLDISSQDGDRLVVNGEEGCLCNGSVGDLKWFFHTDFVVETEEIISVGRNGKVYKWNYQESYRSYEIMKLNYFQPNIKIINPKPNQPKRKSKNNMKNLNGLCISLHPTKKMIYYVSTQEGSVVKCSMSQRDRFQYHFAAHAGPAYGIVHSPFSAHIFCTYGSDWFVCMWAEDLREPLLRLYYTKQPVLGMSWSPSHSTIFVTISGHHLSMWDLARKTIVPISTVKSSTGNNFTSVQFSTTGKNVLVGDVVGDVFVFSLVDMPYPPFLQEEALIRSLQKGCVSSPQHCAYLEKFIKQTS